MKTCTMAAMLAAAWMLGAPPSWAAPACEARSGPQAPTVVELYTSEGCSSCPPADRWLSGLPVSPQLLALAFHVDYWDALGWQDRFASPAHTQRQRRWQKTMGTRFVYTPQAVVNGADWRGLPGPLPARAPVASSTLPSIHLLRQGRTLTADVLPPATSPPSDARFSGYWAVLENGLQTAIKAGENQGALLRHDHVVRRYVPVPSWPAGSAQRFSLTLDGDQPSQTRPVRAVLVIEAPLTLAPVQALALDCPAM